MKLLHSIFSWLFPQPICVGLATAHWATPGESHKPVFYYLLVDRLGKRSVKGFGHDWKSHQYYRLAVLPWLSGFMEFDGGAFYLKVPGQTPEQNNIKRIFEGNVVPFKKK